MNNVTRKWVFLKASSVVLIPLMAWFIISLNPFKKKDSFISQPVKYKKKLNNDGGIGWVPYYGKPGRSCKEDKDCPTFQKCEEDKCVIPPRVR